MGDDFSVGYALGQDNGGNGGFGNWSDSWVLIILFALIFGWGNGGWAGGIGGGGGTESVVQRAFDTQTIINKLNGLENGLCDGFYAMNTGMLNGFHGVDNAVCTLGYQSAQLINGLENTVQQSTNTLMAGQTALGTQLAQCCCEQKQQVADLKYTIATEDCATRQAIADASRAVMDNCNANYRSMMDYFVNSKIADLQAENQSLRFAASQEHQNNYLISALRPAPVPAFNVPAPWQYGNGGCGCA